AVRDVQVLQAPHIAEAQDAVMSRLEKQMTAGEETARSDVTALAALVGTAGQGAVSDARGALDRFSALSRQLVGRSRRNSNVRSLEIALHQKPALTAACDDSLGALIAALAKAGAGATR